MPLLEIVRTEKTSAQVILDLFTVGKIIKKVPVMVGNCTGFAANRAFFPYGSIPASRLGRLRSSPCCWKGIISCFPFMRREASQNLIFLSYHLSRNLDGLPIPCLVESF
ncbi:hypothetical protein ACFX2F_041354 [Malus domestica]